MHDRTGVAHRDVLARPTGVPTRPGGRTRRGGALPRFGRPAHQEDVHIMRGWFLSSRAARLGRCESRCAVSEVQFPSERRRRIRKAKRCVLRRTAETERTPGRLRQKRGVQSLHGSPARASGAEPAGPTWPPSHQTARPSPGSAKSRSIVAACLSWHHQAREFADGSFLCTLLLFLCPTLCSKEAPTDSVTENGVSPHQEARRNPARPLQKRSSSAPPCRLRA